MTMVGGLLQTLAAHERVIILGLSGPDTLNRTIGQGTIAVVGFISLFIICEWTYSVKKMSGTPSLR